MELTGNVSGLINLGGGGSTVEVTPILTSGEHIADIEVDGVTSELYAPEAAEPTEVEVTQVLTSGTKIATIGVDGDEVELYAPTPEAPTEVEVTQVVTSGTKIATIAVDDEEVDLYAPSGGGDIERSGTEKRVGTGYNGKPIYQRTFHIGISLADGSNDIWSYYTGLYNVKVVLMNYKNATFPAVEKCNNSVPSKGGVYITYQTNNGALRIGIDTGFSVSDLEFTLEYQKSSD